MQGGLRIGAIALRWAAAALALVTLTLGAWEGVSLVATHFETREVLRTRMRAADALLEAREYRMAWELLGEAASRVPDDPDVLAMRIAVARTWLLDAHSFGSERTFLDMVDTLVPFLSTTAPLRPDREQAELLTLLAFTQRLRERSEVVDVDVDGLYRRALDLDPDCGLAHLLFAHDIALWQGDLESALPHFAHALRRADDGELDLSLVRRYQFAALTTHATQTYEPESTIGRVELLRAADDVRRRGEALVIDEATLILGRDTVWHDLERLHKSAVFDPAQASALRQALPPEQHLLTLRWLREQRPEDESGNGLGFWIALVLEEQGDLEGAAAELQNLPEALDYRLGPRVDEVLLRLTGQPHRPLRERDFWAWMIETLATTEPSSPSFAEAWSKVRDHADAYRDGRVAEDERLLQALEAAHGNWSRTDRESDPIDGEAREQWRKCQLSLGILLTRFGEYQRGLDILSTLAGDLPAGHLLRGQALVAVAAAHAGRAQEQPGRRDADVAAGIERIAQALDEEHYADWARLRWRSDLRPLRDTPRFAELLKRHGRPPAESEVPDVE